MARPTPPFTTKVATLALPTRETHVVASVWPGQRGTLLYLAELNLAPLPRQELAQAITQELERSWREVSNAGLTPDATLEHVLLDVNRVLAQHQRLLGNPLAPRYQLVLAYCQGNDVALGNIGHLDALVVSADKLSNALALPGGGTRPKPSPGTFEQLITGHLEAGESLLLATSALTDYFSAGRLQQVVFGRTPGLGLREIEQFVLGLKVHPPLGLICLRLEISGETVGTGASMDRLLQTKSQTSSLLQPKLWSYLKARLNFRRPKPHVPEVLDPDEEAESPLPPARGQRVVLGLSWNRWVRRLSKFKWLLGRESSKSTISWWLEGKLARWHQLPTAKRVVLVVAVVVLVAFCQSIVNLGKNRLGAADSDRYNQLVAGITEQHAAIEAALIYNDNTKAQGILSEARQRLTELPQDSRSRSQQWQALQENLEILARRLERRAVVENPPVLAELPSPGEQNSWVNLVLHQGAVYAATASGQVSKLTSDGKTERSYQLPREVGTPTFSLSLDQEILFMGSSGQAVLNPTNGSTTAIAAALPLTDAAFYQGGIYYLGSDIQAIFRTTRQGSDFSSATRWLKSSQGELNDPVSLTVDGAIYVASPTAVEKFSRGLKQTFSLEPLTPPLEHVSLIRTSGPDDNLYLWSLADKRLVIYDKDGKLVIQLEFPTLTAISAISLDGQNKYLYLLQGNTIYRVGVLDYSS